MNLRICLIFVALCSSSFAQSPGNLKTLRESYHRAVERATKPLKDTYQSELKKLLDSHTKAGRLDEALEIRRELDALKGVTRPEAPSAPSAPTAGQPVLAPSGPVVLEVRGSNRYRFIPGEMNHEQAETAAKEHGGILASFSSPDKLAQVAAAMKKQLGADFGNAWVGLKRSEDKGEWIWYDGTKLGDTDIMYGELPKFQIHTVASLRTGDGRLSGEKTRHVKAGAIIELPKP